MEVTLYRKHIHAQKLKVETLGKDVNISSKLTIKTKELVVNMGHILHLFTCFCCIFPTGKCLPGLYGTITWIKKG